MNDGITIGKWHGLTVTVIHLDPRLCTMHFELSTPKGMVALAIFGIHPSNAKHVTNLRTVIGRDPRLYTMHFELSTEKGVAAFMAFGASQNSVKLVRNLELRTYRNELSQRLLNSVAKNSDHLHTERSWEVGEGDKPIVDMILEELAKG